MFNDQAAPASQSELGQGDVKSPRFVFKGLPVQELIRCRDEITALLPPTALAQMNLEEEMLLQFHATRALQNDVITSEETPANQKAQVANACASSLVKLTELQEKLYTSERLKAIERVLIQCLRELPEESVNKFMEAYTKALEAFRV